MYLRIWEPGDGTVYRLAWEHVDRERGLFFACGEGRGHMDAWVFPAHTDTDLSYYREKMDPRGVTNMVTLVTGFMALCHLLDIEPWLPLPGGAVDPRPRWRPDWSLLGAPAGPVLSREQEGKGG